MCKEIHEELARGTEAAKELIAHIERMGSAGGVTMPNITYTTKDGRLQQWKVQAELVATISPER